MKIFPKVCFMLAFLAFCVDVFACTAFIISGKVTPDGKPILFKHRDSDVTDNAIHVFNDGKYSYAGLVNSREDWKTMVWGGYNSAGFAIVNSAAYNNNSGDTTRLKDREGIIMKLALMVCATLDDFENLLDTLPKPLGVDANFGVIDAYGGASWYETGNFGYNRFDAGDPAIAPEGFLVRTNHSFTGDPAIGYGYIRYNTAVASLREAMADGKLAPPDLFCRISRNLTHSLTGTDLANPMPELDESPAFRFFLDYIPRISSASSILIVGTPNPEQTGNMVMWAVTGFPLAAVAVPVWLSGGNTLPAAVSMMTDLHSPLCNAALKLKERCFPIARDRGQNYIDMAVVINKRKTGIMQKIIPVEETIYRKAEMMSLGWKGGTPSKREILEFYKWVDSCLESSYLELFGIQLF